LLTDYRVPAWLGDTADVLVLAGNERTGCLLEQIDKYQSDRRRQKMWRCDAE